MRLDDNNPSDHGPSGARCYSSDDEDPFHTLRTKVDSGHAKATAVETSQSAEGVFTRL